MSTLRDLLGTWETWSAHDTLIRALTEVTSDESREPIATSPTQTPVVSALAALRASTELVELITGWQWQAIHAARREGASWTQVGSAMHTTGDQARAALLEVLNRQEQVLGRDVSAYRDAL